MRLKPNKAYLEEVKKAELARVRLRKVIGFGALGAVIVTGGVWFGWSYLSAWRLQRDQAKAEHYEKEGDYRRALLTLEQVVQIHPFNFEARRNLAGFYQRAGQPQALVAWNSLTVDEPYNPDNWIGLAKTALAMFDQKTAQRAVLKLQEMKYGGEEYSRLAAATALLSRDSVALEERLAAVLKLQPDDANVRLSLAALQIKRPDEAKQAAARTALVELAKNNPTRMRAVVELLSDAARQWPEANSRERDAALAELALTLVPARGPRVGAEQWTAVDRLVAFAQAQPDPKAEDVALLLRWMVANNWSAQALRWLDGLEAKIVSSEWVKSAAAEAAFHAQDWERLRGLLVERAWGVMPIEAYDRALALRRLSGKQAPVGRQWAEVVELCRASLPGLQMLLRFSRAWEWPQETQQTLQAVAQNFPRESWAWRELVSTALAQRNTELLWRTYYNRSLAIPGDTGLLIEAAMVGLLTKQANAPGVSATAEYLRREPQNSAAKIVHALALRQAKQAGEAVVILDALPKAIFTEPRYALVYGLVLSDVNRAEQSTQLLEWAEAGKLLPEELALLKEAQAHNAARLSGGA